MRHEIQKHWTKIRKISKLSDAQLETAQYYIFLKIQFINEELIPEKIWLDAEKLVNDFDIDDTDFVALTKYLKGFLWTGDKILYNGLVKANFKKVCTTSELLKIRNTKD